MKISEQTLAKVDDYWAAYLACSKTDFNRNEIRLVIHTDGYLGLFAFFRGRAPVVSLPEAYPKFVSEFLTRLLSPDLHFPARFAAEISLYETTVLGPTFIGYADEGTLQSASLPARLLTSDDRSSFMVLQAACSEIEWQHGGSPVGERPTFGVFVDDQLVALAGYEIWKGVIAHIYAISHPEFRGKGHARTAVAHLARHAIDQGLIPQYRTLSSNQASMRLADSLGFCQVAISVAARFHTSG